MYMNLFIQHKCGDARHKSTGHCDEPHIQVIIAAQCIAQFAHCLQLLNHQHHWTSTSVVSSKGQAIFQRYMEITYDTMDKEGWVKTLPLFTNIDVRISCISHANGILWLDRPWPKPKPPSAPAPSINAYRPVVSAEQEQDFTSSILGTMDNIIPDPLPKKNYTPYISLWIVTGITLHPDVFRLKMIPYMMKRTKNNTKA